ncbi:MAG: sigma-70 family RNA polymerase sigma factor [Bdellovibrionales bacterium]|nr:sigma-70 family RNA polymerase sigma factor [Bdellovibrionales bacterium]
MNGVSSLRLYRSRLGCLVGKLQIAKETPDDQLVDAARGGDREAFRELVERYQHRVHSVAMGILGNFEDARDITQEAFIKAHRNLGSFRRQSSFYTWLYRITFNLAIDERRKRFRHVEQQTAETEEFDRAAHVGSHLNEPAPSLASSPDRVFADRELGRAIADAMTELSPEHRAVITLREIEGMSYAEISEVVGCSKGTVMSRLHHARKRLQRALMQRNIRPGSAALDEDEEKQRDIRQ